MKEFLMDFFTLHTLLLTLYAIAGSVFWTTIVDPWLDRRERNKAHFVKPKK